MTGPLTGLRVVEVGGIGPGPFAGMMLADLGAEVIRVERDESGRRAHSLLLRGRRSVQLDLKSPRGREAVLALADTAEVLLEGFRPGVMERLGLGPDVVLARNPRLVYGRVTGWGQDGPLAPRAGHDINYIALAGALEPVAGRDGAPTPPLNMLGDFGGGGMLAVCGVLAALLSARATGRGQVVDAAVVDGAALMTAMLHSMRAERAWSAPRGENLLDGGAPFYGVYETRDGRWVAVGAIEPAFYAALLEGLGLTCELGGVAQDDTASWPRSRARIAARVRERTRDEWVAAFAGADACLTAVLAPDELLAEPHLSARETFVTDGALAPAPAPRFSATPSAVPPPAPPVGADTRAVLAELGLAGAAEATQGAPA
ncbi:CaiB/BaiF CoA transferase family protein [Xylanimonas ulmi]|uniref:Alpha-methylacyl-CoA racemase n=1 Tax=Xylanimonas ulmi TaxID=228973 RepID=A0A4Q7M4J5_9MICO|nr:CaiB/BaiF CoA-transferase family protein [Xylanibacterium ulmi]RZS61552.1 alpha-methylacyl-CoA racemase [Xylanibacterium ulmi]